MSGTRGSLWLAAEALLLASGSAARGHLLEQAHIPFIREKPLVDERALEARLRQKKATASDVAMALARAKALDVSARFPSRLALGADQTLDLNGQGLNKPADLADAREHLRRMSGHAHHLNSAAVLACDGQVLFEASDRATMLVRPLSEAFLDRYLEACGNVILSSVGAYQMEALGLHLFERIDGDHATIMGLPLLPLLSGLRQLGFLAS
jgi:septum formation protein